MESLFEFDETKMEAWTKAIKNPNIIGLVFDANENAWFLDSRFKNDKRSSMVFGSLGVQSKNLRYRVPEQISGVLIERKRKSLPTKTSLRVVTSADELDYSKLKDPKNDVFIVPVISVDGLELATAGLKSIRMVGFANKEAVQATLETGFATFYSRSSGNIWTNGETTGNRLEVIGAYTDCDRDSLLLDVTAIGPTCHTNMNSCFEDDNIGE